MGLHRLLNSLANLVETRVDARLSDARVRRRLDCRQQRIVADYLDTNTPRSL